MSKSPLNRDDDKLIEPTPEQLNPALAKATDFIIEDRDGGQCGDSKAERMALLQQADSDGESKLGSPIPDRNTERALP